MSRRQIERALDSDQTIDIITTGARTGLQRKTEIWFTNVAGEIIICGTPAAAGGSGPRVGRDWLANLTAHPDFIFCLKESVQVQLPAQGTPVRDMRRRRALMLAPETQWYRDQVESLDDLIARAPIVDVFFTGEFSWLNARSGREGSTPH